MSLISALYTGASGLDASSTDLSVIGDNISNSNTTGFKSSRVDFSDAMAQQLIGGDSGNSQVGLGVQVGSIQQIITQGSLSNTGIATDLAIQGNGYFAVKGTHDGQSGTYLTRDGEFTVDATGNLVNADGLSVQGYTADATGKLQPTLGDLKVGATMAQPSATANVTMQANLNGQDTAIAAAFDPTNPATYNASNSVTVYDGAGAAHQVDVFYTKTAANTWTWNAQADGAAVGTGQLAFDPNGTLNAVTPAATITLAGGNPININFGDPTSVAGPPAGTGLLGVTQFASPDSTSKISQDGFAAGSLSNISIDSSGKINGAFTNGQTRVLGQVATAVVASADKMTRVGGNLFLTNPQSGDPTLGAPSTGGRGGITAGALEQSNVDLANEFVHMISTQRAYQANGKTVTTADALLVELMNIKR